MDQALHTRNHSTRSTIRPGFPTDLGYYDLRVPETRKCSGGIGKSIRFVWLLLLLLLVRGQEAICMSRWKRSCNQRSLIFHFAFAGLIGNWTAKIGMAWTTKYSSARQPPARLSWRLFRMSSHCWKDDRYIRINGKPLLLVYRPEMLPDSKKKVTDTWREETLKRSIGDLFLVRSQDRYSTGNGSARRPGF